MVWFGGTELERPPLSAILPRLYLGAESDVTQERLASLDISYILSVSRCSPQPSFLPFSRYLRVPIDDSLSEDLLPWIPQALTFIDSALCSGASVLVHCAAGISRSPALTVAYIMYRMGLDHAYRFVKERRPSISPNLNFLGQLQHFQGTLKLEAPPCVAPEELTDPGSDLTEVQPTLHQHTDQAGAPAGAPAGTPATHKLNLHGNNQDLFQNSPKPQVPCLSVWEKRKSLTLSLTPVNPTPSDRAPARACAEPVNRTHTQQRMQQAQRCPRAEHKEALLSLLGLTLNRLLSWGERLLLAAPVRMGQPALPYSC